MLDRVTVDGKFFRAGGGRFRFHGVSYGTFRPREDGSRFPDRDRVKRDFDMMSEHGVTVVRTYTPPPDDVVELASDYGLRLLAGLFYPDWRYLVGAGRRDGRRVAREAAEVVRRDPTPPRPVSSHPGRRPTSAGPGRDPGAPPARTDHGPSSRRRL